MTLTGTRTYVGFGFGAIQAGLFLYEAFRSEAFRRLIVAEVLPEVVSAVRRAEGYYTVNIAHSDQVEHAGAGDAADDGVGGDAVLALVVAGDERRQRRQHEGGTEALEDGPAQRKAGHRP